ncbi:MAG: gliding motility-associated C-terminal domain-containing protein [Bacteroidetes bacterium]|nr:gliding motility-associated C-terminal domain-containing protein [Bacteroidota bacterium]
MKRTVFILVFCFSKLWGQVSPPALRCLEVLPNNNVKLTWISPTNPNNNFDSYDIYFSATANGIYASLNASITNIGTTTFTHITTTPGSQSLYYYMVSRYKDTNGNLVSSSPSDTLRTIFLNLNPNNPLAIRLTYNNLHQPKLPSSSATFSVQKEFPTGTWNNFASISALGISDTLSICGDSISYQIKLADNIGCISSSNIQRGKFSDTKPPARPYIDSISVLPNGQTVLAWRVPYDKDIAKYQIYYRSAAGVTQTFDVVQGRQNTSYTYTFTTAETQTVKLFVAAIDSCPNAVPGLYDESVRTMFLETEYDKCAYETSLTWSEYGAMPNGFLEYRIYYSEDNLTFTQVGATKNTTFTHGNVSPDKTLCYFVRAVNSTQTISSSSNRVYFFSTQVPAPNFVYLKSASIKSNTSAELRFYIDTSKTATGIEIHRSSNGTTFTAIGFLPSNGSPNLSFTDKDIKASSQSYFYKGIIRDSCGNAQTVSNLARTMLLKAESDKNEIYTKHLSWNNYNGFSGGIERYNVYRVIDDVQQTNPVANTSSVNTAFDDRIEEEAASGSKVEYLVEAIEGSGNPYNIKESSFSNLVQVYVEGTIFIPTAFAPRGVNKIWKPVPVFIDKAEYRVTVFDRWGKKVFETDNSEEGWDGEDFSDGVYVYLIRYKNSRGEYKEEKGTLFLMR